MKRTTTSVYTFQDLIEGDYFYLDKTRYIYNMIEQPKGIYFVSRPRRFGKSLMLSTLKAVFQGKKELFKGLFLENADYNWKRYPIIHIEMGSKKVAKAEDLESYLYQIVTYAAKEHNIELTEQAYDSRFLELVIKLGQKEKVVILIDEYDKPILSNVTEPEECQRILKSLKGFYSILKGTEEFQRFVMLTGVSKFSRVSVFSDLNNLEDLTMSIKYATMFGYTQEELEANFDEPICSIAENMNFSKNDLLVKIKSWYNGYCFHHLAETVYNPVSAMKFFDNKEFSNYWFETGTPSFLIDLIKSNNYALNDLDEKWLSALSFSSYEITKLSPLALLLQTGYLTITDSCQRGVKIVYKLGYPNLEIQESFSAYLADSFACVNKEEADNYVYEALEAMRVNDLDTMFENLQVFFANVPYDITIKNEKYYQTIFYVFFKLLGVHIKAECRTNRGRIDAVVELDDHLFIFEFKLTGTAEEAMDQIKKNEYFQRYQNSGKAMTLVAAAFDPDTRNLEKWLAESI